MDDTDIRRWAIEHITNNVGSARWTDVIANADKLAQYVITGNVPEPEETP